MSKVFLKRLEETIEKSKGETISLPSVASQVVLKYYEEENRNMKRGRGKFGKVKNRKKDKIYRCSF